MIVTVTPNPSIDLLYEADTLVWDDANRVEMPRRRAGGQGINLSRAARLFGEESLALAFFGGSAGDELRDLLESDRTPYSAIPIEADTRVFVAVRETATGRSMLINPRGPVLSDGNRAALLARVREHCNQFAAGWLVCSGSIPRGIKPDLYAEIADIAHGHSWRFIADCDGEPLRVAVRRGCDLLAPNQHEAERLLERPLSALTDAAAGARSLLASTRTVLLKLGERGAILANAHGSWHAQGPVMQQGSAVGAGDAFLAAYLVAEQNEAPPEEALRNAVAAGSAVLLSKGSELLTKDDYEGLLPQVSLSRI